MLAIRMQRTGRKGHAQFRLIVQDSRFSPTSGRIVDFLGNYDPHTKEANLSTEKIDKYLSNGAQPSDRVIRLLAKEGFKLPVWVKVSAEKKSPIKKMEKLRRNRPAGASPREPEVKPEDEEAAPEKAADESTAAVDVKPDADEQEKTQPEPAEADKPADNAGNEEPDKS